MRIAPRPVGDYPFWLRPFFASQRRRYGEILLPGLLWGRVPRLFAAVALLYGALDRKSSPLPPVLRSLVTVRVSQLNRCRFCVDINSMSLAQRAGSMAKVEALEHWRDSDLYDPRERVALEYAEAMSDSNRSRHRRVDAAGARPSSTMTQSSSSPGLIAFQNLSSKFNSALDVPGAGVLPGARRP